MRTYLSYNLKLRIDLDRTLDKNLDRLVRPTQKLAQSITEISCKVCKPNTYNKVMSDPINANRWQKIINKKL